MSIDAMKETRRKGDSKRLDTLKALTEEARKAPLTLGRESELVKNAIKNATGLNKESSRNAFRHECGIVLDPDVYRAFPFILGLAEKIWEEGKLSVHSKYHLVIEICKRIRGNRNHRPISFAEVETYYARHGKLPE
jgi:hypothetical protein